MTSHKYHCYYYVVTREYFQFIRDTQVSLLAEWVGPRSASTLVHVCRSHTALPNRSTLHARGSVSPLRTASHRLALLMHPTHFLSTLEWFGPAYVSQLQKNFAES